MKITKKQLYDIKEEAHDYGIKQGKQEVFDEIKKIMEEDYKGSWLETIEKKHLFQKPTELRK